MLTETKKKVLIEHLLPRAIAEFTEILRVSPVQGPLKLSSYNCGFDGGVSVTNEQREQGTEDTDLLLFLTARPIGDGASATGWRSLQYAPVCDCASTPARVYTSTHGRLHVTAEDVACSLTIPRRGRFHDSVRWALRERSVRPTDRRPLQLGSPAPLGTEL